MKAIAPVPSSLGARGAALRLLFRVSGVGCRVSWAGAGAQRRGGEGALWGPVPGAFPTPDTRRPTPDRHAGRAPELSVPGRSRFAALGGASVARGASMDAMCSADPSPVTFRSPSDSTPAARVPFRL